MKCVSYTRTMPWKNHKGELTIADQNQRIAEYLQLIFAARASCDRFDFER